MKKKLLAIDGNSILNRAFYGIRPLTTKDGFSTNALYGLVTMVTKQAEAIKPDFCAIAFDLKAPTFRHKMFDAYKAGRRPMPEELAMQLPVAKELMRAMGYTVLEKEGYEADDILGTLASMCESEEYDAYLMTGDRDALQLISDRVHILLATNTETIDMDKVKFFEKYGVDSTQFVDVKALMGDSSDNIPGVPGIGEKGALKLIAEYGSLDAIYEALPVAKHTPSLRAKLENGHDSAYLSRDLARICREVPLEQSLNELADRGIDRKAARDLFIKLEFSAFIKRFELENEPAAASMTEICITEADLETVQAQLQKHDLIAYDGNGDSSYFATEDGIFSVNLPLSQFIGDLAEKTVVCYDVKAVYKQFDSDIFKNTKPFDLMLGAYLVNSAKSNYEPATLVSDYLGELIDRNVPFVSYFLRLYEPIVQKLRDSRQEELMHDLEMPLAAVLADMETIGFYIDRSGISTYGEQLGQLAEALEAQIWFQAGKEFNINSPKQLGEVLFDTLGLPHAKKTKTGYSTNAEILEKLRPYHAIIQDILDYRQVTKLKSTYTDGLLKVADENGRVHTTFKQTGTATGRLSSTEPNLQNIPIKTEMGRELRRFFLPASNDYVIVDADYSQIELRLLAHISRDSNMISAFMQGADIHTSTAAAVFDVDTSDVTLEMRKKAKAVNFGIMYGIGAFSLSDDIGVSRAEAQVFIDKYLNSYPAIDAYLKDTIRQAYESGYVTTLFGRRRYIPELAGTNKMQQKFGERVAMNSPIQGTAADIIKLAMIRVHKRLQQSGIDARLILQVHDELLIEAHKDCAEEARQILREEMESAVNYSVPLEVDIHIGQNWYEAK